MSQIVTAVDQDAILADRAYDDLSRLVLTRKLQDGSLVVGGRLAQQLDVSRTPTREAILRLAAEGLLVKQGSRSYAVRQVQPVEFFRRSKFASSSREKRSSWQSAAYRGTQLGLGLPRTKPGQSQPANKRALRSRG